MLIKTYTDKQIYARPKVVARLRELTNQGPPHDFYSLSAMRGDLSRESQGYYFLAWIAGKIIAWALMDRHRSGRYQISCYVAPEFRRKGIGTKLCKKAKAVAAETGETVSYQDQTNGLGYKMYEAVGFCYACRY